MVSPIPILERLRGLPSPLPFVLCLLVILGARYWQCQRDFQNQAELFPQAQKGLFRVWVSEEPETLFEHLPGSHDTGRENGSYQPFVKEVRAVCTLVSIHHEDSTEPGTPSYIKLPPIKVRCSLRLGGFPQPALSYGDLLEIRGKIQPPSTAMNPGQFDYARYLKTKGVAYVLYGETGQWRKILPVPPLSKGGERGDLSNGDGEDLHHGWFFLRWSYGLKRWAEDNLYRYLPFPQNALLDGILLGERSPLPDEMVRSFFLTGTIHILAVSGMITAFVAGLFFMVFRALQLGRKWAAGMSLVALAFFVFMTGAHPPVCRAGLFSGLALLAVLLERRLHGGVLLLSTAVILLFLNPFALADLSFQISFLATAGLMVMSPWMMEKLHFLWRPAAWLVTATTAAQLAVWCLILHDFNQLSVYSVLSNLLIVPLALFSTAGGLTLLGGAALHPTLGSLFGAACEAPLRLLTFLADGLARLPKAEWIVASPPFSWVLIFHALLLVSFYFFWPSPEPEKPSTNWLQKREGLLKGRRRVVRAWGVFLLGTGIAWGVSALGPKPFRIIFLDVGHGNAVVLRPPSGKVLVVDGGRETRGPDRFSLVVSYLRHEGVQKVDAVLNTHPDEDHVGGLVNILSAYPVGMAYEGARAHSDSRIYGEFKETLEAHGVRLRALKEGDQLAELNPVQVAILHPPDSYSPRLHADNNRSLVSLVSFAGSNLMLPGDLEKDGIMRLFKGQRPFPKIDWLMAPHHGRLSGEPLLCAKDFKPRFVVLSDWRDYPDDHTDFQSEVPGVVVLSTALEGAIEVEINPNGGGRYRTYLGKAWKNF